MDKRILKNVILSFFLFTGIAYCGQAQTGYVRASGTRILDNQGNNLIFRGIGTGNWMLQEGYMMNTSGATNGTQWNFREKLVNTIGEAKTVEFYNAWLDNHFRKIDVDSMAKWGFNMVRVAMHYKVFTLPVEKEPVAGQDTWLEDGFVRLDNLLSWCAENKMYLILDMHGCPGAQGDDSNISDYDNRQPSLWQSEENKRKLVALWRKLAQRYAGSPWIGGYDLINEPKWTLPNNNKDLWDLYKRLTTAIREVDTHHMIIIEGNNWGNDYNGLPALWDANLCLSFHKYWNRNDAGAIDWIVNMGNSRNCPVWLGETGENSNTWFTDCVKLCESKNVGWSFWPVKKTGQNNILKARGNTAKYNQLLNAWRNGSSINATTAFEGVMEFAEGHKFENCTIMRDVIDAMIIRPQTDETRPFKQHIIGAEIFAVDYDYGPVGKAYYDTTDADYHGAGESYTTWNQGYNYRNDGVDIQSCSDAQPRNGYSVAWIVDGEWLNYTIESPSEKSYTLQVRYASQSGGGQIYVEVNGKRASKTVDLPATGSWDTWSSVFISNVIIPQGTVKLKLVFEKGGFNFNWFNLTRGKDVGFDLVFANTHATNDEVQLNFSKDITSFSQNSFAVFVNGENVNISRVRPDTSDKTKLFLALDQVITDRDRLQVSYILAGSCKNGETEVTAFNNFPVDNTMATLHHIPCRVEAEEYLNVNNFTFQACEDAGGGQNAGYTSSGSYLDFFVYARYAGKHQVDVRVAVNASSRIQLRDVTSGESVSLGNISLNVTGGWQNWATQSAEISLREGKNILRVFAVSEGFNLNWIELKEISGASIASPSLENCHVYAESGEITANLPSVSEHTQTVLFDLSGKPRLQTTQSHTDKIEINASRLPQGMYLMQITTDLSVYTRKIVLK
ncbi:MAG: carbohydrate-binding protein [Dysgonamonadaceae bacterium]|jgi:hypothetical protein|nr:carbohydrate-binding protein [Dysgonamonadaceae bacterium]